MSVKYFAIVNGQIEELKAFYIARDPARRMAGEKEIVHRGLFVFDAQMMAVGRASDGLLHAAERVIQRKANPSNHKCGAKCRHATGKVCECECGGKFHGVGK
jgi:hypothetical protein